MLLKNPKFSVTNVEVKLWRYLYKIPSTVEILVPMTHERKRPALPDTWVVDDPEGYKLSKAKATSTPAT